MSAPSSSGFLVPIPLHNVGLFVFVGLTLLNQSPFDGVLTVMARTMTFSGGGNSLFDGSQLQRQSEPFDGGLVRIVGSVGFA